MSNAPVKATVHFHAIQVWHVSGVTNGTHLANTVVREISTGSVKLILHQYQLLLAETSVEEMAGKDQKYVQPAMRAMHEVFIIHK